MTVVFGVDPGTLSTGYGVVAEEAGRLGHRSSGVIVTKVPADLPSRLRSLFEQLNRLIERHRPDRVVIENSFLARNTQMAFRLGQARGVAMLSASLLNIPVMEYTPAEVKMAVCGYGNADKPQIQAMVARLLRHPEPISHHAADALAAAICYLHSAKMQAVLKGS
jgi:crossover junction endodeoxyribonuclease RuvC